MKILEAKRHVNPVSFIPEMIVKISLPLQLVVEGRTKEEEYMLIGKSFFDAFEEYHKSTDQQ